ncbi:Sterol-sensing domain and Patched family-containing protein [Aphelenchoides fujianensis]|nr:Sterol-sensing domain and Patched family-containing protein [Aphelenchoides fujianensis]
MRFWSGRRASVPIFGHTPPEVLPSGKTSTASATSTTSDSPSSFGLEHDDLLAHALHFRLLDHVQQPNDLRFGLLWRRTPPSAASERTAVSRACDWIFRRIGHLVAKWPKTILIVMLLFTAVCSAKIAFTEQEDDLKTGYTPNGARSHFEFEQYAHFYDNVGGEPLSVVVFVQAKDNGTMTRVDHLNETLDLLDVLGTEFRLAGRSFYEFCLDFCELNEPIRQFRNGLLVNEAAANLSLESEVRDRIELTFPFMHVLGRRLDLSSNFFGVQTFASAEKQEAAGAASNVQFLKLVVLQFRADRPQNATKEDVVRWERSITDFVNRDYTSTRLKTSSLTVTLAKDEIVRTGLTLFPYLSVGFAIMSAFAIGSVFISSFYFDQWSHHKISMSLWACVCPLLATSTALGLMFWCGVRFGTILLGVDDAFIMLHSWQRLSASALDSAGELRRRTGEMLVDIGPSITITSLTNILAFAVGIVSSPTPEIQLFCAGNCFAIAMDYFFQLFLYVPVVVIAASFEEAKAERTLKSTVVFSIKPATVSEQRRARLHKQTSAFMSSYCSWLSNRFTSAVVLLLLSVYWIVSFRGISGFVPRITPNKLFLADSIINDINRLRDAYILPGYTAIGLFVNDARNLSDPPRRQAVERLVHEFEARPESLGAEFTHFWLRDYERYLQSAMEDEVPLDEEVEGRMQSFLEWPEYRHWNGFLRFDNRTEELTKFFVILACHGPQMVEWTSRGRLLNEWRAIVDKYPELEAFVWVDEAQFLDQIETLVPVSIQSSVATLICMTLVCVTFMNSLFTLVIATIAMCSICIGVFGFLSFWGIDLDPISLCVLLMSIGFSVDFPAHLTFHFFRLGKESGGKMSPEERIHHSLVAIGFPLIQCGLSTILFVLCLCFVDTYMSEVFVKTMVLVVSLGLVHGLFFVPSMLCTFSRVHSAVREVSTDPRLTEVRKKVEHKIRRIASLPRTQNAHSIAKQCNPSL